MSEIGEIEKDVNEEFALSIGGENGVFPWGSVPLQIIVEYRLARLAHKAGEKEEAQVHVTAVHKLVKKLTNSKDEQIAKDAKRFLSHGEKQRKKMERWMQNVKRLLQYLYLCYKVGGKK